MLASVLYLENSRDDFAVFFPLPLGPFSTGLCLLEILEGFDLLKYLSRVFEGFVWELSYSSSEFNKKCFLAPGADFFEGWF